MLRIQHPTIEGNGRQRAGSRLDGPILAAALRYAELGWAVLPVHGITRGRCTCGRGHCGNPGKHPRTQHGVHDATTDLETITAWFHRWPTANLAVATGQASGIVVLDVDGSEGEEGLWKLVDALGVLPRAPTARTGRGRHLFFRCPARRVRNRISLAPGIDIRGEGGYVVVPPSKHANGSEYTWQTPPEELPPPALPEKWIEQLTGNVMQTVQESGSAPSGPSALSVYHPPSGSAAAISEAVNATLPRGPGQRHRRIFDLCRWLKGIPELCGADAKDLEPIVREWHRLALPVIRTKAWEETWFDFLDGWDRVRCPGAGVLEEALKRAKSGPLPAAAMRYDNPKLRLLVGLCRELQRHVGDRPFFLSCEDAARAVSDGSAPSAMTAWRWLSGLVQDKVLRPERPGERGRATEYRYVAEGGVSRAQSGDPAGGSALPGVDSDTANRAFAEAAEDAEEVEAFPGNPADREIMP